MIAIIRKYIAAILLVSMLIIIITGSKATADGNGQAGLSVFPVRVILKEDTKYQTLLVKNTGKAKGKYAIEIVDHQINENREETVLKKRGKHTEFTLKPYTKVAPRRLTLEPNQSQKVRLIIRRPKEEAWEGEYRSSIRVIGRKSHEPKDVAPTLKKAAPKGPKLQPEAIRRYTIPMILHIGKIIYAAEMHNINVTAAKNAQVINLELHQKGNTSHYGTIKVVYVAPNNEQYIVLNKEGIKLMRETEKIQIQEKLNMPPGIVLENGGKLKLSFEGSKNYGDKIIDQKEYNL